MTSGYNNATTTTLPPPPPPAVDCSQGDQERGRHGEPHVLLKRLGLGVANESTSQTSCSLAGSLLLVPQAYD